MWTSLAQRAVGWLLAPALLAACAGEKPDEVDDPVCPYDIESFCAYEFGGACPTYEEAAAMSCDRYHFDTSGTSGNPVNATDGETEADDCSYPIVSCSLADDPNARTRLYFTDMGAGTVFHVMAFWAEEDEECPIYMSVGDLPC